MVASQTAIAPTKNKNRDRNCSSHKVCLPVSPQDAAQHTGGAANDLRGLLLMVEPSQVREDRERQERPDAETMGRKWKVARKEKHPLRENMFKSDQTENLKSYGC